MNGADTIQSLVLDFQWQKFHSKRILSTGRSEAMMLPASRGAITIETVASMSFGMRSFYVKANYLPGNIGSSFDAVLLLHTG